jgi:meso-butanediol dehydrogenase/(S,S)-butanediol dehydrogenase/diacetyl reductase
MSPSGTSGGRLQGRVAVVTGAGSGIGRAIAIGLANEGAKVVAADRDGSAATETATTIGTSGTSVTADVTDRDATRAMFEHAYKTFGRLDVGFNIAGVNFPMPFLDVDQENFDRIMQVNAWGVYVCMQEMAKLLIEHGAAGKIVNVASTVARRALPASAPYSASKAAVVSLVQAGAQELAPHGITVNAFAPGVVMTPLIDQNVDEFAAMDPSGSTTAADILAGLGEGVLLQRAGTTDDVVPLAVYLASTESDYVTGQTILIDGGTFLG